MPTVLTTDDALRSLHRGALVAVAYEHMLWGHLIDRALMPELIVAAGIDAMEPVAIGEWMGASPNYTRRMRTLMGVEGDSVADVMKALQLDVGFVHEYMDVGYRVTDDHHGEFWLNHCGALVDVEPFGERQIISMCHHIEDPTFDATAVATNPRVRIRPVHRPPRRPEDRVPVCHWSIVIDPANDALGPAPIADRVGRLALARVALASAEPTGDGLDDYAGPFRPELRLSDLSSGALRVVLKELALQAHLVAAAGAMVIEDGHGAELARSVSVAQGVGVCWVGSRRLRRALGLDDGLESMAQILALHPLWPTGVQASVEVSGTALSLHLDASDGLLDPNAPGWLGHLAGGDLSALTAATQAIDPRAVVSVEGPATFAIRTDPGGDPAPVPQVVDLLDLSGASTWTFTRG